MKKKKVDKRILQTRQSLSDALTTLLQTKAIETITVIDLVSEAQINRSTFYLHYNSLENFMTDLEHDHYVHFRKQIVEYFDTDTGWLDHLMDPEKEVTFTILDYVFQLIEKNTQIQAFMGARLYDSEFLLKVVDDGFESAHKALLASGHDVDINRFRQIYSFVSMGCVGLIFNWIGSGMKESSQEISNLAHKLVKHSLKSSY
ncbi:MAG TPA: TetR/AcrR family transcriptional regulator [Erysipelothrix sp.]|nr:TetR/AcrR family transcriptional regulator [Erysipelothrix sp.]